VHTPGVFVQRVVEVGPDVEKRIERRTTRPRAAAPAVPAGAGSEQSEAAA
jgi:3-oxoacid CoA-transferase subunit A